MPESLARKQRRRYATYTMFVRCRETAYRLQLSLVETRRVGHKVKHTHIAALGSIATPLTVAGRVAFWQQLHARLARLDNRLAGGAQDKVMAAVHARIPIPSVEEQRSLQLENAKAEAERWSALHGIHAATVVDRKGLAARVADQIAQSEKVAAQAETQAQGARDRVAALERGEDVAGGFGAPVDPETVLRQLGWTDKDLEHVCMMSRFTESEIHDLVAPEILKRMAAVERAAVRAILKERGGNDHD